jgi:hypothetical protein
MEIGRGFTLNKELYDKANKELDILLEKCPELLALQAEISYTLAMMDNKLERIYYTQELMLDKLDELKEAMEAVNGKT